MSCHVAPCPVLPRGALPQLKKQEASDLARKKRGLASKPKDWERLNDLFLQVRMRSACDDKRRQD